MTSSELLVSSAAIEVQPIAGNIGAEVSGVDLTRPLTPDNVAQIREALLRWKVIFFRNQRVSQGQHVEFARHFGDVTPAHPTLPAKFPEHPEIFQIDVVNYPGGERFESRWHTDVTFVVNPPMGSILRGVEVPPYGGDTQWTNLAVAYERLSAPLRDLVDGLHAVHTNMQVDIIRGVQLSDTANQFKSKEVSSVHPVVRVHPETGERVLFVNPNFTRHIVELSRQESRHLLAMLYEHMAHPSFTCRYRWQPDSIAFWDNRATAHFAPSDVPDGHARLMQRVTIAGDIPIGIDGAASYSLCGGAFR